MGKSLISIILMFIFVGSVFAEDLTDKTELAVAPNSTLDWLYIVDGGTLDKKITPLTLMRLLESSLTSYEIHNNNLPTTPQFTGVEVGHASDTTLARSGAGDITVEGHLVYRAGGTDIPDGDVADDITAGQLAANGGNCSAGSYPLGVDAAGAVEGCTDASTEINSATAALLAQLGTPYDTEAEFDALFAAKYGANDEDPEWGTNDTTQGHEKIYGASTDDGGKTTWYNAGNKDGTEEYWSCQPNGTQWECGPTSDPDMFIFSNTGAINPATAAASVTWVATDSTCANDEAGKLTFTPVVGDLGNTDILLQACRGGTLTTLATFDESTNSWVFVDGIKAPYSETGTKKENYTTSPQDLETDEPNTYRKWYIMASGAGADVEFDLQADGLIDDNISRDFLFSNLNATYDLIIDPNGTDVMSIAGTGSCTAGYSVICQENEGATVRVLGRTNAGWTVLVYGGTCACGS